MEQAAPSEASIIYDWNTALGDIHPPHPIEFLDETLRDGIQSPSAIDPPIEAKLALIHLMDKLGIAWVDIGLPGAGPRARADVKRLATEIRDAKLRIKPTCAARTVVADVSPVVEISQEVGIPITAYCFIGSSPIRQYAEDWDLPKMLKHTAEALDTAAKGGIPAAFVTEDTTRADPKTLEQMFKCAIDYGATTLCLCDTVGHATPAGVKNLVAFAVDVVKKSGTDVKLDWHGHNDRGLSLINCMAAMEAGVHRAHGTALGIGERVGNVMLDQLLVNARLLNWVDNDLSALNDYCQLAARASGHPLARNYPVMGADAFVTATGVHAAAIVKARKKGDAWLADRIYSGVPASMVGKTQKIEIGHMSGLSNVRCWLEENKIAGPNLDAITQAVFEAAKATNHTLSDDEIWRVVRPIQAR